jgi:hypothetical protein
VLRPATRQEDVQRWTMRRRRVSGVRFGDRQVQRGRARLRSAFAFAACPMALAPNLFRPGELYNDERQAWYLDPSLRCAGVQFVGQRASSSHAQTSICSRPHFNHVECRALCPSRSLVLLVLRDHARHRRLWLLAANLHAHAILGFVGHTQFTAKHWMP